MAYYLVYASRQIDWQSSALPNLLSRYISDHKDHFGQLPSILRTQLISWILISLACSSEAGKPREYRKIWQSSQSWTVATVARALADPGLTTQEAKAVLHYAAISSPTDFDIDEALQAACNILLASDDNVSNVFCDTL